MALNEVLGKVLQNWGRVQGYELVTTGLKRSLMTTIFNILFKLRYLVHGRHISCMSPVAVMHTSKCDALAPEVKRGEHHVGGVQGVDEVWWEAVLVLASDW